MPSSSSGHFGRLFRKKDKDKEDNAYEEEIISLLQEGHESGVIQKEEAEMISGIFQFTDKDAKDIMTIRKMIVGIDDSMSVKEAFHFIVEQNYSRFPLYHEDLDDIVGVLHLKDVARAYITAPDTRLCDISQEPYFVHEAQDISTMFSEMQRKKNHMAIVVDEYGQTTGIVAMEDILEVIVGDIQDEHDEEERDIIPLKNRGEYIMSGMTRLDDIEELLGIQFPEEDYDTLNGFLIFELGHLPDSGENINIDYGGYSFHPLRIRDNMMITVRVSPVTKEENKEKGE